MQTGTSDNECFYKELNKKTPRREGETIEREFWRIKRGEMGMGRFGTGGRFL